jgi:acetolactate synthase-1/3 small subunit
VAEPQTSELNLDDLEVSSGLTGRKHLLSLMVENRPGVLARIALLFSRRGFNIDTLAVGPTEDPDISRITLTVDGAVHPIDQVTKQLHKLVNVIKIRDLEPRSSVHAELLLVRVAGEGEKRTEVLQIAEIFKAKIVDVDRRHVTLRVVGATDKVEAILELLKPLGILEVVRTGAIAIGRGRG